MTHVLIISIKAHSLTSLDEVKVLYLYLWLHDQLAWFVDLTLDFGKDFDNNIVRHHLLISVTHHIPEKELEEIVLLLCQMLS